MGNTDPTDPTSPSMESCCKPFYLTDVFVKPLWIAGIFQVGVPQETIESVMGKRLKTEDVDGIVRWSYPNWNVDFNGGKFIKLSQAKPVSVTK